MNDAKAEADKQADLMTRQAYPPPHIRRVAPSIDYTAEGPQYMIPDAPTRKVPTTGLKPKRPQTEKPTLLEIYETEQQQPKLF